MLKYPERYPTLQQYTGIYYLLFFSYPIETKIKLTSMRLQIQFIGLAQYRLLSQ